MMLRFAAAFLLCATTAAAQQQQQQPQQTPSFGCTDAVARQFDFWVGRWNVHNPAGQVVGQNTIDVVEQGCALQETWIGARGSTGRSFNFVERGEWHQLWVANTPNSVLRLKGGLQNGAMRMSGTTLNAQGATVQNRITWTPLPNGELRQLWETSADGSTWQTVFDGRYVKR